MFSQTQPQCIKELTRESEDTLSEYRGNVRLVSESTGIVSKVDIFLLNVQVIGGLGVEGKQLREKDTVSVG